MKIHIILIIVLILILFGLLFYNFRTKKIKGGSFDNNSFKKLLEQIGEDKPQLIYENKNTDTELYSTNKVGINTKIFKNNRDIGKKLITYLNKEPLIEYSIDLNKESYVEDFGDLKEKSYVEDFGNFIDELITIIKERNGKEIKVVMEMINEDQDIVSVNFDVYPKPTFNLDGKNLIEIIGCYSLLINTMLYINKIEISNCELKNGEIIKNVDHEKYIICGSFTNLNKLYLIPKPDKFPSSSNRNFEIDGNEEREILSMKIKESYYQVCIFYKSSEYSEYSLKCFKYLLYLYVFETYFNSDFNIFKPSDNVPFARIYDNHYVNYTDTYINDNVERLIIMLSYFINFSNNTMNIKFNPSIFYMFSNDQNDRFGPSFDFFESKYLSAVNLENEYSLVQHILINYYILIQLYLENKLTPYKDIVIYQESSHYRKDEYGISDNIHNIINFISFKNINALNITTSSNKKTQYKFIDNRNNLELKLALNIIDKSRFENNYEYIIMFMYLHRLKDMLPIEHIERLNELITIDNIKNETNIVTKIIKIYTKLVIMHLYDFKNPTIIPIDDELYEELDEELDDNLYKLLSNILKQITDKEGKFYAEIILYYLEETLEGTLEKLKISDKMRLILNLGFCSICLVIKYLGLNKVFPTFKEDLEKHIYKIITTLYNSKYLLINSYFQHNLVKSYVNYIHDRIIEHNLDEDMILYNLKYREPENMAYYSELWNSRLNKKLKNVVCYKLLQVLTSQSYITIITTHCVNMDAIFMYKFAQVPKEIVKDYEPYNVFIGGSFHARTYEYILSQLYQTLTTDT